MTATGTVLIQMVPDSTEWKSVNPGEEERHSDFDTTDHNSCNGSTRHGGDPLSAFSYLPGREADAEICTVSWKSASGSSVRPAGYLLSEGCERFHWKSRHTGADLDHTCDPAPCVETADAPFYCRRDGVLYAACAAGVLISILIILKKKE